MPDAIYLETGRGIRSNSNTWYRIIENLGVGGNAATFLVFCTSGLCRGHLFAMKIFRRLSMERRRARFLREVTFLKGCSHPAVVPVFDDGLFYENPFVLVEYMPETLRQAMTRSMSVVQKVGYTLQLLSALSYLASRTPPVVHRDIKPENIFVKGNVCVLGDFGLIKFLTEEDVEDDRDMLRESYGPRMPFYYRTPDLLRYVLNGENLTPKTDVFQLGLVIAELFTGLNPQRRPDDIYDPVELDPVRSVPGGSGPGITTLVRRMLAIDPAERPSAEELIDPFQSILFTVVEQAIGLDGRAFKR
jgi:serine/threonine protein kinase